jgi:hypothetical protein
MREATDKAVKAKRRYTIQRLKAKVTALIVERIIDRRFASIPPYPTLRVFAHLSKVSQWTGAK